VLWEGGVRGGGGWWGVVDVLLVQCILLKYGLCRGLKY